MVFEGKSIHAVHANFHAWFSTAAIFASSLNVFLSNVNRRAVVHLGTFSLSWQFPKLLPRTWKNKPSKSSCINVSILIGMRRESDNLEKGFSCCTISLQYVWCWLRLRAKANVVKDVLFICELEIISRLTKYNYTFESTLVWNLPINPFYSYF